VTLNNVLEQPVPWSSYSTLLTLTAWSRDIKTSRFALAMEAALALHRHPDGFGRNVAARLLNSVGLHFLGFFVLFFGLSPQVNRMHQVLVHMSASQSKVKVYAAIYIGKWPTQICK
jgi:hypothetical protein